jgi:hypothetical protein
MPTNASAMAGPMDLNPMRPFHSGGPEGAEGGSHIVQPGPQIRGEAIPLVRDIAWPAAMAEC